MMASFTRAITAFSENICRNHSYHSSHLSQGMLIVCDMMFTAVRLQYGPTMHNHVSTVVLCSTHSFTPNDCFRNKGFVSVTVWAICVTGSGTSWRPWETSLKQWRRSQKISFTASLASLEGTAGLWVNVIMILGGIGFQMIIHVIWQCVFLNPSSERVLSWPEGED